MLSSLIWLTPCVCLDTLTTHPTQSESLMCLVFAHCFVFFLQSYRPLIVFIIPNENANFAKLQTWYKLFKAHKFSFQRQKSAEK